MTAVTLPPPGASLLTDTDRDLIRMLADGNTTTEISRQLDISEHEIVARTKHLRGVTATRNTRHLITTARRNGWIGPAPQAEPNHVRPIEHGTLSGYVHRKCRCDACTEAARIYANRTSRLRAYGQWQPLIDAQPVRDHLAMLARHGIGWMRAAQLAGVSSGGISKLLYGTPTRPPTRRVRPETAARILALRPTLDLLADEALTDATGTRRRLQALMALGFTQAHLAARLGAGHSNFRKVIFGQRVRAKTARAVIALYDELWDADPVTCGVTPLGAERARRYADSRRWPPPAAWDDDTIDDPDAKPDAGARARRQDALAEDAEWIARTSGDDPDHIAARLGITRDYLDHVRLRHAREPVAA